MSDPGLFELKNCTLADLISTGEKYLLQHPLVYGHGTDNAFDESAWLALEACDLSPVEAIESYDVPVSDEHLEQAKRWFRKRAIDKKPVAYITGRAWFSGLEFVVDERALIPRSPLAELILNRFEPWLTDAPATALDLCCGGGCMGIAMASAFPLCEVDMVDLSQDALDLAAINVEKHNLGDQVNLHKSDLFQSVPSNRKYDLIVSNPPYVDAEDMNQLAIEFSHEPQMGLVAGHDGLDIVARLLRDANKYLKPDGILVVEVGNSKEAVNHRFPKVDLLWLDFEFGGDGVFLVNGAALG